MKDIRIKAIHAENFKGLPPISVDFGDMSITDISGANATGKTSINDLVTWVLFGKDSKGSEKFEVRRLLPTGEKEHQTVISGMVQLVVDGVQITFQKDQKEIWQTKRGFTEQVFKGNQNAYMINGFPISETEYKARISEVVDEDTFRMITSPMHFVGLPWQKQRQVLMGLASDKSDEEIAVSLGMGVFDPILDDLRDAQDTDAVQAKYRKALADLNAKQKELPVRIDEALRGVRDLPFGEYAARVEAIDAEIKKLEIDAKTDSAEERKDALTRAIINLRTRMKAIEESLNLDADAKRNELTRKIAERHETYRAELSALERELRQAKESKAISEENMARIRKGIEKCQETMTRCNADWKRIKGETYQEGETTCPCCGQPLPAEMLANRREVWEADHTRRFEEVMATGKEATSKRDELKDKLAAETEAYEKILQTIEKLNADAAALCEAKDADVATMTEQMSRIQKVDPTTSPDYVALMAEHDEKRAELDSIANTDTHVKEIYGQIGVLREEKRTLEGNLALKTANENAAARAEALRAELREVSEKALVAEHMLELVDQFVREKLDYISNSINSKFEGITWKLFDMQINGGIRNTCELMVNGVPFNTLNNGARICAGLRVIKTMQEIYGVRAFTFVDNSESVNSFNFPQMENQMIFLRVTDSQTLEFKNR